MSSGISIPGVTDRYKTNDLVESLMAVERVPLEREQSALEGYQTQQNAWRAVNQKMSSLRDSVKALYSFENPFNNKLATSSEEDAITVDAGREADFGSFKIDVIHPATTDRFLSGNIEKNLQVPSGNYTFQVGTKTIDMNWKGGKISDFVTALNRRGGTTIKASLIGISPTKQALLIESLEPGLENRLVLKNQALEFATSIDMVQPVEADTIKITASSTTTGKTTTQDTVSQEGMPSISKANVSFEANSIKVAPRGGFELALPEEVKSNPHAVLEFSFSTTQTQDITQAINSAGTGPQMPDAGSIEFRGISIDNNPSQTTLQKLTQQQPSKPLVAISDDSIIFLKNEYGIEVPVETSAFTTDSETGITTASIRLNEYPGATTLVIRNSNTGKEFSMEMPYAYDASQNLGFEPKHAIATAEDAVFKYEGITITRSTNDIDDVVPHVTLHLHDATEKTATININPDKESAKNALINFVGTYNQVIAQINILTINKPEIITELEYLTSDEIETENQRLGMFTGDFSLTNAKSTLQRTISGNYSFLDDATVTMLAQIGISTNASSGTGGGYNASQMRGYLEIDEKKLDAALETDLAQIKNIFGYDTDGDLIIDSGIGYLLDRQLTSWVQSGGIISSKTQALNTRIEASNKRITQLEDQLARKEAELKSKYATMEGTLNSLERQSNSLNNTFNNNSNK